MRHRASRLTPQPITPGRRVTGVTAILSLVAASGVAVVIGTSFASTPKNLIANSGFEDNLTGWTKLSSPLHLDLPFLERAHVADRRHFQRRPVEFLQVLGVLQGGLTVVPGWLSARAIFVRMVSAKALTSPRKSW